MKIKESLKGEVKSLDEAMAILLTKPSIENALSFARKVKIVELKLPEKSNKELEQTRQLYYDAINLHHAILIFESDPKLVEQNALARVLSGLTPALLSLEEYLSGEDVELWELLIDGSAVVSHFISTTPYVTSSKITVDFRFQEELVKVEDRLSSLLILPGKDVKEGIEQAAKICDSLRKKNLSHIEKPGIIFVLWYSIVIISYKNFKDLI